MKMIYVCSRYQNAMLINTLKANLYCKFVSEQGFLPLAPHTIFTQFLEDRNKGERALGLLYGKRLLELCDELWVFGIMHSKGMIAEIEYARKLNKKIKYFSEAMEEI